MHQAATQLDSSQLETCPGVCLHELGNSISETWHSLRDFIQPMTPCILSDSYVLDIGPAQPFSAGVPDLNLRTQKLIRVTMFSILTRLKHNQNHS